MREIHVKRIIEEIARLCIEANSYLDESVAAALLQAHGAEISPVGQRVLTQILRNIEIAAKEQMPLCQDTGVAVVFIELGQDLHIVGGNLNEAIHEGVRRGYSVGYLRKSLVAHPFSARENTGDNTPAVLHIEIVPGDTIKITVVPKGGGSENMSQYKNLPPAAGADGILDFVCEVVDQAGANACPPIIVGVGIGGTMEHATLLAKKSLLRPIGQQHSEPEVAALEGAILERINCLGIGPQGLGGLVTALSVHLEVYPCHIASLPVAVNLQCHSARHKTVIL